MKSDSLNKIFLYKGHLQREHDQGSCSFHTIHPRMLLNIRKAIPEHVYHMYLFGEPWIWLYKLSLNSNSSP